MVLGSRDISDYLELYDCPVDLDVFTHIIFELDNNFIDEHRKSLDNKVKKK